MAQRYNLVNPGYDSPGNPGFEMPETVLDSCEGLGVQERGKNSLSVVPYAVIKSRKYTPKNSGKR